MKKYEQAISEWAEKRDQYSFTINEIVRIAILITNNKLSQLDEQFKELQRIHKGFLEQLRSIDVKKSRIEFEINRLTNLLEEEYEIDFDEAKNEAVELDDVEQIRKKVKLLKQSIEELGPVNLTAIEEYERVLERHTFLTEQRNDLIEAQQTLTKQLEKWMKKWRLDLESLLRKFEHTIPRSFP